jgi:hypothetical protein
METKTMRCPKDLIIFHPPSFNYLRSPADVGSLGRFHSLDEIGVEGHVGPEGEKGVRVWT